jgi:aryl-alcohol dehydrogenase-like predicted oxidoreductase
MPAGARLTNSKGLAGRYLSEKNWGIVEELAKFCEARGHSLLEVAFSWLLARRAVASVIAGATQPEQLEANVHAVEWQLTPEDLAEVDRITKPA